MQAMSSGHFLTLSLLRLRRGQISLPSGPKQADVESYRFGFTNIYDELWTDLAELIPAEL